MASYGHSSSQLYYGLPSVVTSIFNNNIIFIQYKNTGIKGGPALLN